MTDAQITVTLNQEGLRSAKGKVFTPSMVKWMRYRYEIPAPPLKASDELTVRQVAERFAVSVGVVYYWIDGGHLPARRIEPGLPYWITLGAEKEAELRAWVANTNRLKSPTIQNAPVSGAIRTHRRDGN